MAKLLKIVLLINIMMMVFSPALASPHSQATIASTIFNTSGIFSVPLIEGDWAEFANVYDPNGLRADIILTSQQELSIVQAFILFEKQFESTQALSDELFTDEFFNLEWSEGYERKEIIGRTVGERFLTVDFDLSAAGQGYVGRQISWQESGHVFNLRFVVPISNIPLLGDLQKLYIEKYTFYPHLLGTPFIDTQIVTTDVAGVMVKLPADWVETSQPEENIVGYTNQLDLQVFIWQIDDGLDLADYEAVAAWILGFRDNMHMLDGRRVQQAFGTGYLFSYTFDDPDAGTVSAALAMFPAHDDGLNLVEVGVNRPDVNLLDDAVASSILDSVTLLAPDDYIYIAQ